MNNSRQFGKNVFTFGREVAVLSVYAVAAAVFAFYLSAIPVKLAFVLRIDAQSRFAAGVAIFSPASAVKSADRRAGKPKKKHRKKPRFDMLRALLTALSSLRRSVKIEQLNLRGQIGASDAAATALICGCAGALEAALRPQLPPSALSLALTPDFSGGGSRIMLSGIVSLRAGHIMRAALIGAWNYLRSGGFKHGKTSN